MTWFDILKEIEMDETALQAREFAEENCCANIWKSIAQEQRAVFSSLKQGSLWTDRKTTEGCRRLVEWLREGVKSEETQLSAEERNWYQEQGYDDANVRQYKRYWHFDPPTWKKKNEKIHNQKKGWLQDYVDCRNLKDGGNRPPLEMY